MNTTRWQTNDERVENLDVCIECRGARWREEPCPYCTHGSFLAKKEYVYKKLGEEFGRWDLKAVAHYAVLGLKEWAIATNTGCRRNVARRAIELARE